MNKTGLPNFRKSTGEQPVDFIDGLKRTPRSFNFFSKMMIVLVAVFSLLGFNAGRAYAQANPNEALWSDNGYSLKKVVSNTSIASGVNFSYTIIFSAPAGVPSISIQDLVPTALQVVSVTAAGPVCGVTPTTNITGNTVTYNLTSLPGACAPSGSFTIVVKFPEGVTCNGATARNRAEILVNQKWQVTPYVSTTATAVNPWKVSKSIIGGASVNPNGGSCGYMMAAGDTITYRLSVMKDNPYWGNVIGQQNMTSAVVTDLLPAGAQFISSSNPCATHPGGLGGTITWNVNCPTQLLDAASPWAYYWVDIKVKYPSGAFPVGTQVLNQSTLAGVSCNQQSSTLSNQTCIEVKAPNPSGSFGKYLVLTNRVPGCSGLYYIAFCNNGNVPLTAFNINDAIPSGIAVNQVQIYGASPTTSMNLLVNGSPYASGIVNSYNSGTIVSTVTSLQFQMTGSLPVGGCIYMYVNFTIKPNPTGTVVTNCATFVPLSNALTLPQSCASFTVEAGTPVPCLLKDICSPQPSNNPGDIVRFRLRVQNIGSASLTGASIQDVLDGNFTYVGNETYYVATTYNPPCSTGGIPPAGTTAWAGVLPLHSVNNLSWTLPTIPSDCQLFYAAYCGYYGTWGLPYYYIEFDAKVSNTALPGVTPNFYKVTGGNLLAPYTSNTVNVLVVASFGQEVSKLLSTDAGVTFATSGTVAPGSNARYRLNYKNTSNVPVSSIKLIDLLGKDAGVNDWLIFNRAVPRGSQFDVSYVGNHTTSLLPLAVPPAPSLAWAAGQNICLPPYVIAGGCVPTTWTAVPDRNIAADYGNIFNLAPNTNLMEDFDVGIPLSALNTQKVCNDFAAIGSAKFLLNGLPQTVALTPVAAPPVCLTIDTTHVSATCCDSIKVTRTSGSNGVIGCCTNITATCPVKSIKVTVTNGTISSASWNCPTPIPPAYIGQSTYTFAPAGCIPSLNTCFNATTTGLVTVTYDIEFTNGEKCQKKIELDCTATQASCCDNVKVGPIQNPNGATSCCARIVSKCEVKSIDVTVTNGTLSSVAWNCATPVPAGYAGLSTYTFAPGNCALDMTTCVDAKTTGIVTITFDIVFANGEKCQKKIELDCTASQASCCDQVKVAPVQNADGTTACCAEIFTKCEVKSIDVTVTNGTLSSVAWTCATPVPVGYAGLSNYTFAPGNCALDMTTCINATTTGIVTITYDIVFANGEKCQKKIELDCTATQASCCDQVKVVPVQNTTGTPTCCAEIITKCEVKSIAVTVTNGTLGSVAWTCATPVPAGYAGLSTYTFAPGNCALDMTTCINATTTGIVTITYDIVFANGEKCQKKIELDCNAHVPTCCEGVKIEKVSDATGTSCCARITTTCKVKAIDVTVSNGYLSSTSWNCVTPVPAGYVGQSNYTFAPNGCVIDMTNCVSPKTSGVVVISYIIYFENGEKCEKKIELDCNVSTASCCDSVKVEPVISSTGVKECCARVTTTCKVKAVDVSITNGTFSSTSWNCATPVPAGYIGQSSYTFAPNGCVIDMTNCVKATQSGIVVITYVFYFENGEKCEKKIELDCSVSTATCCDKTKVSVINSDKCCAKLTTECEVKFVSVSITNGTIGNVSWNAGALPVGYVGQSSYIFLANNTILDMDLCVNATTTGSVVVNYVITFSNGEKCEKSVKLNCTATPIPCCALIEFKLKAKWPFWKTQVGSFHVINADPSVPICYIEISPSPAGIFTPSGLLVNGVTSAQSWTSTRIPASGNLTPSATNTIDFSLTSTNYKGVITICVVKCDGTRCCFDYKWTNSVLTDVVVGVDKDPAKNGLAAVSISPVVNTPLTSSIKYVSFGFSDEKEVAANVSEFYAISASANQGEEYPDKLASTVLTFMGKNNAFFELAEAKRSDESLGFFNLVFRNKLPKLGCTLYDVEGNILFSGGIAVSDADTITSTVTIDASAAQGKMFEFINMYPNPSNGSFQIAYATGNSRDVEIKVYGVNGQVIHTQRSPERVAGIHNVNVAVNGLAAGLYKVVLISDGEIRNKSLIIK